MQLGQADKYCGKAHGLGSRFIGFCNPIWICNWIKQIHSKVKSVPLISIVPILLNKEVWTKLGSCYKVQGWSRNDPVPCPLLWWGPTIAQRVDTVHCLMERFRDYYHGFIMVGDGSV